MTPDLQLQTAMMPEARGLRETAKEWWLSHVGVLKSDLYVTWPPHPPTYRRGWTYALAETARFEVVAFTRESGDAALAVVMHEPADSFAVGWFAATRADEAHQAVERLNTEVGAIWKHWRSVQGQSAAARTLRRLTFEQGHEYAPDARWGVQVVELSEDGTFTYQQRRTGQLVRVGDGSIAADRAHAIFAHLGRSTFPHVAAHPFPPGASVLTIAMGPDQRVSIDRRFGLGLDGYREAIADLSDLVSEARDGSAASDAPSLTVGRRP